MEENKKSRQVTTKPLQAIPFKDKIKDDYAWAKNNHSYFKNSIPSLNNTQEIAYDVLWDIYNGIFPTDWFKSVTNSIGAIAPEHKSYAAKIRPTTLLRNNLDLLKSEFAKKPFPYQVVNKSSDAYNSYEEEFMKRIWTSIQQHFVNGVAQAMRAQGQDPEKEGIFENPDAAIPEKVKEEFPESYQDAIAAQAKDWLENFILENNVWEIWKDCFLDYLVEGSVQTFKYPHNGTVEYKRQRAKDIFYPHSETVKYIEDMPYVVARYRMHLSEIVDFFYDKLDITDFEKLDQEKIVTPSNFQSFLMNKTTSSVTGASDLRDVYHVCWRSIKRIGYYEYLSPETSEWELEEIDEDDPRIPEIPSEQITWEARDEIWGVWEVADGIYADMGPIAMQRGSLEGTKLKLPYNGRVFSGSQSDPTSVLKLGIPLQLLHLIGQYKLEEAIASNPGKIAIIDKNSIPVTNGWNEEKFFYHAKAMKFAIIDRNQKGVDKSWNQYQVLDMSTWEEIRAHIDFLNSIEDRWDKLIGISPQRKSQTQASETATGVQASIEMSSIMTEHIFDGFYEFMVRELQGLIDCSQLANIDGVRKVWHGSDMRMRLLEINPDLYCHATLGVHATVSAKEVGKLENIRGRMQAFIQNGLHPDIAIAIELADSVGEIKQEIKKFVKRTQEAAEQAAKSEQELQAAKDKGASDLKLLESALAIDVLNADWDRKDNNTILAGEVAVASTPEQDNSADIIKSAEDSSLKRREQATNELFRTYEAVQKMRQDQGDNALRARELDLKDKEIDTRKMIEDKKASVALKNKVSGEK